LERLETKVDALVEKINDLDKRLTVLEERSGILHR